MSRESKLVKNTILIGIGTFLPKLTSFIILPILTGILTKEEYGTYDLITVLVSLLLPAVTLQVQAAAFRFLIDVRNDNDKIQTIVTNIYAFIFVSSIIALTVLYFSLSLQSSLERLFICLYFFADIIVNASRQVCRGIDRNLDYSISAVISAIGKMTFTVIFVYWLRIGLLGTVISLFAASTISLLYLVFKARLYSYINFNYLNKKKLKEMLHYSWPMVPNSMSAWVMRASDRLVVTAVMGIPANAVYGVANKIPSLLNLAQNTFTMAWQENASIVSRDEDASEYYSRMFRTLFDLMAGFFGVLIASTPLLFKLLIRGDYSEAYNQIPILFLGMFFFSLSSFLGGIYVAHMKSKSVGITTMIAAAINLATDIGTINWIGLYAASGSTLISYIFLFLYRIIDVQKITRIRYDKRHLLLVIFIIFSQSIMCYIHKPLLNIANAIIGTVLFFALNKTFVKTAKRKIFSTLRKRKAKTISFETQERLGSEMKSCPLNEQKTESVACVNTLTVEKQNCCGCSACYAICPVRAITMAEDSEGFLYPHIDENKCIKCNKCLQVCSFKENQIKKGFYTPESEVIN